MSHVRGRLRHPRALAAVAVCVGAGVAVFGGLTAADGSVSVPQVPSLLTRQAQAQDALPGEFAALGGYADISDLSGARLAGRSATRSFYLVPGDRDQLCVVATRGHGADFIAATTCQARARFDITPLVLGIINDDGTADVAALSLKGPVRIAQRGTKSSSDSTFAVLDQVSAADGGVTVDDKASSVEVEAASLRPAEVP